jgi:hypothetical protein
MVFVQPGEEITYTADDGEDREATVCLMAMALGCVAVTETDWSEGDDQPADQHFIIVDQIHGVTLSENEEVWEMDGYV